jgi:hypothetical protein
MLKRNALLWVLLLPLTSIADNKCLQDLVPLINPKAPKVGELLDTMASFVLDAKPAVGNIARTHESRLESPHLIIITPDLDKKGFIEGASDVLGALSKAAKTEDGFGSGVVGTFEPEDLPNALAIIDSIVRSAAYSREAILKPRTHRTSPKTMTGWVLKKGVFSCAGVAVACGLTTLMHAASVVEAVYFQRMEGPFSQALNLIHSDSTPISWPMLLIGFVSGVVIAPLMPDFVGQYETIVERKPRRDIPEGEIARLTNPSKSNHSELVYLTVPLENKVVHFFRFDAASKASDPPVPVIVVLVSDLYTRAITVWEWLWSGFKNR